MPQSRLVEQVRVLVERVAVFIVDMHCFVVRFPLQFNQVVYFLQAKESTQRRNGAIVDAIEVIPVKLAYSRRTKPGFCSKGFLVNLPCRHKLW